MLAASRAPPPLASQLIKLLLSRKCEELARLFQLLIECCCSGASVTLHWLASEAETWRPRFFHAPQTRLSERARKSTRGRKQQLRWRIKSRHSFLARAPLGRPTGPREPSGDVGGVQFAKRRKQVRASKRAGGRAGGRAKDGRTHSKRKPPKSSK